ncbi:MAG TPA: hypothetical protein VFE47_28145 [Tepidisphaeraceae bacterium]|jgi:hypothetical protein|nr:hypothetical protein [Tepidisphaeraceae bacterium]
MSTLEAGVPLADVAEILYAANVLGSRAWRPRIDSEDDVIPQNEETLRRDLIDLFSLIHSRQLAYLLVGGVAMLTYVEGRNTKDVDLVLSIDSLKQLPEVTISDRNRDFARGKFRDLRVDVLFTTNPLFKLVQEQYATTHRFLETDVRCATVEGLILLKLYALPALYLQGDGQQIGLYEGDIFLLLERHRPNLAPLFDVLKPYVGEDQIAELKNIATDIQRRIERVDRAKKGT